MFQAAEGKKNQKWPNAIGSQMKAQWSSVAIAWQEAMWDDFDNLSKIRDMQLREVMVEEND